MGGMVSEAAWAAWTFASTVMWPRVCEVALQVWGAVGDVAHACADAAIAAAVAAADLSLQLHALMCAQLHALLHALLHGVEYGSLLVPAAVTAAAVLCSVAAVIWSCNRTSNEPCTSRDVDAGHVQLLGQALEKLDRIEKYQLHASRNHADAVKRAIEETYTPADEEASSFMHGMKDVVERTAVDVRELAAEVRAGVAAVRDQQVQLFAPTHGPRRTANRHRSDMLLCVDPPRRILVRGDAALANGETKTARRTPTVAHHGDACLPANQGHAATNDTGVEDAGALMMPAACAVPVACAMPASSPGSPSGSPSGSPPVPVPVVASCGGNLRKRKVCADGRGADGLGDAPDAPPPAKSSPDSRMHVAEQHQGDDHAASAGNGAFAAVVPTIGFTD